ncbi:MAG: glycosyltransferase family 39 protein [Chloroflexota bacterium]
MRSWAARTRPLPSYGLLLWQLLLASLLLRALWLNRPSGRLIFDEHYYVNAARVMLGLPVPAGQPYAGSQPGLDPNTEHPPLGKLLIAGSMALFGDNPYGWRVPAVLFGTAAIGLTAAIVRAAGGSRPAALAAAFLVAFDNLAFVHSRVATLDIFVVGFSLAAVYCWLRRWPVAAGTALALAGLVKINGLWLAPGLAGLEVYLVWRGAGSFTAAASHVGRAAGSAVAVFGGGLFVLDRLFTRYRSPIDHLRHILSYGLALKRGGRPGESSFPWQWLLNQVQMPYYHVDKVVQANGAVIRRIPEISFTGAMNPYLIFLAPAALGFAAYCAAKRKSPLAALVLCWVAATYLPFFPLAILDQRVSYIFYFLPTVPAVAIAVALLLDTLPTAARLTYLAAYLFGFASLFPFRTWP